MQAPLEYEMHKNPTTFRSCFLGKTIPLVLRKTQCDLVNLSLFLNMVNDSTMPIVCNQCEVGLQIPTDMWLLLYFPSLLLGQLPHWCTGATLLHSSHPWPWKHRFYCLWRFQKLEGGSGPCVSWPQLSHSVLCWVLLGSHQDHLSEMHMGRREHELAPRVWKDLWQLENFPRKSESFHCNWFIAFVISNAKASVSDSLEQWREWAIGPTLQYIKLVQDGEFIRNYYLVGFGKMFNSYFFDFMSCLIDINTINRAKCNSTIGVLLTQNLK